MPSTTPASTSNAGSVQPNNVPQHASSSNLDNSPPEHGLRFVANHHRQHNPHDPKLRASPVFKSRRSSLLGSVLKSKPRSSARASAAASPHLRSLNAQSHQSHHQHTQSLPTSIRPARLDPDARHRKSLLTSPSQVQHSLAAHSTSHAADPSHTRPPDLDLADSPPVASLPSPVDQPDGSASTCSSTNAKDLDLASHTCSQGSPPLVDVVDTSSMSVPAAHPSSANLDRESQAAATLSRDPTRPSAPSREHGLTHPPSSNVAFTSASAPLATHPSPLPVITHTNFAADDALHGASPVAPITAEDRARILLSSCSPSRPDPSAPANDISVAESASPSVQTIPESTSLAVTSPQRFSSLGRSHSPHSSKPSLAPISTTVPRARAHARDINDELESPTSRETLGARAERRMSMLDFLAADPVSDASHRLAQASVSAEDLPRSAQQASPTRAPASAVARPSMPLMQASRQLRLEAAAARSKTLQPKRIDLCSNVRLTVEPLVDRLTMFGSMQSGSNYSLAGTVVVEVPKLIVPRLSSAAAVARDGFTADQPSVHVEELTVRFTGYSVYVDATGRFNAIKVTESSQQLLQPQGFSCPVQIVETGDQSASPVATASRADQEALKYETEFDLSIPGWLPASQRSRFGATFYCVQAIAIVQGQAVLSAVSGFDDDAGDDPFGHYSFVNMARSLESEVADTGNPATNEGAPSPPTTLGRTRTTKTWLNKTAKQLQLRTARKSTGPEAEQSGSSSNSRRGSGNKEVLEAEDPLFSKATEAGNQCLPDGRHSIKSECLSILVRRCRDVVPVPVARLARLATASQMLRDNVEQPSLSQSMAALARLQNSLDLAVHPEGTPPQLRSDAIRPHMTPSASAPVLSQTTLPPSDRASRPSTQTGDSQNLDAQSNAAAALAPSPRIDTHPSTLASEPLRADDAQSEPSMIMPRAPSAFDSPRDPAKMAAAASALTPSATLPTLPSSMSRASSLLDSRFGNANSPPRTSSRAVPTSRSSAPLRHFVHRPSLHLPPQLGIAPDSSSGLTFSLTLSLPSHVHVSGPKSDVLSFGVQIEVGRTEGWDALRKWGGLRLKDMELVCLQTERHSSMPSRSFCATFPVPPQPNNVDAADLPVVTGTNKMRSNTAGTTDAQVAAERRLRQSYDRSLILGHIALANQGKAPHPIENNVERIRTTIVGPPPFDPRSRARDASGEAADESRKGKHRAGSNFVESARIPSRHSPAGSGANTPDGTSQSVGISSLRAAFAPAAQVTAGSRSSVMQPLPRALTRSNSSSSSSLRQAFNGRDGSATMQTRQSSSHAGPADGSSPPAPAGRSRRPIPFDLGAAAAEEASRNGPSQELSSDTASSAEAAASQTSAPVPRDTVHRANADAQMSDSQRGVGLPSHATNLGVSSSVSAGGGPRTARGPRRSRFETAMSRLSTFASSMLEQPSETSAAGSNAEVRGSTSANATTSGTGSAAAASLRATYAFSGDDAEGVDLTKGRVRMTINLPLVSSDVEAARKAGSAQLIPDFESPYVRVRHKLKVKLGFGLKSNVATGQDGEDWGQVLVMCVPVRFTEAPPKEVQDQFGPVTIGAATPSPTNNSRATRASGTEAEAAAGESPVEASHNGGPLPVPFAEPLLPAYAQLFREDGSRLADEGEDLPRYPGRMSVIGEIDEESVPMTDVQDSQEDGPETSAGALLHDGVVEGETADVSSDNISTNFADQSSGAGLPRSGTMTLPRTSSLGCMSSPMDRSTSLPGRQVLPRASSSSLFGLRSAPLQPSGSGASQMVTLSPFSERSSSIAGGRARVGSSAFDPLPARPGMRRRSATTTSLITSSRIMPAEVLDEALVTSALDDEEDRMDELHPSRTLESLRGGDGSGMDGLAGDEDAEDDEDQVDVEEVEVVGADLHDEDGEDEFLDGVDSNGGDSEAGHTAMSMRHGQFSGSDDAEGDADNVEVGMAF
ncbi:pH-response regulator protein palC [Pseudozyma hubeiensis]|nr:pH-response regulator protein palC [Pseudozyma hubeiensis]